MREIWGMPGLIKRLGASLLAAAIASLAADQTLFHIFWLEAAQDAYGDGQSGMGPVFGAAYFAFVAGALTFVLLFWRSRAWW